MRDGHSPDASTLIAGAGISVSMGRRTVLDNVDISVRCGEIVTLIGPNGSGKTTLVRTLLGLRRPDSGTVTLRPDVRLGYAPQTLTVDRTLPLDVKRFLQMSGQHDPDRLSETLAGVGAPGVMSQEIRLLSGGELKRVLLARALLRDPDLLVLDEPTANVDIHGQVEFYDLIRRIRDERGCSVLLVSHDLHLVMAATDRVFCLNGHICCSGRPEDVSHDPAYLALFGESAAAVSVYSHSHDHHHG
ncbi:MAG: metal ABC transporter ATP-binding protein [Rhodospirillaceae bacterium]